LVKYNFYFITIIIIALFTGCSKNNFLSIHIIDVGQGDSILIQTPTKKNILVDGGDEDSYHIIRSYLRKNKIKSIDYIIATHLDSDHIGSLDNIIDKFDVKKVYTPEQKVNTNSYKNLVSSCDNKNININYLYKDDYLKIDEYIDLFILSPSYIQDDTNSNSIVFKLDYNNKSFLFTGDCTTSNELNIIECFNLDDVDFLKVGHHGSSTSTSVDFLNSTTPDIAAISCGYKNQYGHPHKSVLDNLSNNNTLIYRTDLLGDIVFYSDGKTIFTQKNYDYIK
jgi:competence protein ComEC